MYMYVYICIILLTSPPMPPLLPWARQKPERAIYVLYIYIICYIVYVYIRIYMYNIAHESSDASTASLGTTKAWEGVCTKARLIPEPAVHNERIDQFKRYDIHPLLPFFNNLRTEQ